MRRPSSLTDSASIVELRIPTNAADEAVDQLVAIDDASIVLSLSLGCSFHRTLALAAFATALLRWFHVMAACVTQN